MTTSPTQGEHAQPSLSYEQQRAIMEGERNASLAAFNHDDRLSRDGEAIYEAGFISGWDRHAAHVAAQPAAPQGGAYAELPEPDVRRLAIESGLIRKADSLRPMTWGRILRFAQAIQALRASHGQAPAGARSADELARDLKNAIDTSLELRQQLRLMEEHVRGEVWRWQPEGSNELATMGNRMGVLIYASDLRNLISAAPTAQPAPAAQQPAPSAAAAVNPDPHAELRKTWQPGQRWQARSFRNGQWGPWTDAVASEPFWFPHQDYRRHPDDLAPQPSPTPQADSQPAPEVDEDGERYRHLIETLDDQSHGKPTLGAAWDDDIGFWTKGSFFGLKDKASIDAAIDAERAQGNTL